MSQLNDYFAYRCERGLYDRGFNDNPEYTSRLEFEMKTIIKMGFAGYFLIVQDFIQWARDNDIYVGPGRGSAAGSLVSYCLTITDMDPIRWGLLFERFLNPSRISMPDIDVDFEKGPREKVIQYVIEKYGVDRVAHIGTFNMKRAKASVRSIAKILGHPYAVGDQLAKLCLAPVHGKGVPLSDSIKRVPELNAYRRTNSTQGEVLRWAEKVEDHISNVGVHASGVVISNTDMTSSVPLFLGKGGERTTQWEMNNIEEVGLIKFDFLGLDALTKIHDCVDLVREQHDVRICIRDIDIKDDEVYEKLRSGDQVGIFQLEASGGMQDLLVQIRPTCLDDLTALVAIYRPGPMTSAYKDTYLEVRAGNRLAEYLVPELESILSPTNGWLIYQEQCCPEGSPIWTDKGPVSIEDIKTGDKVQVCGYYDEVTDTAYTGMKECLEIETSAGVFSCTPDHKVLAYNPLTNSDEFIEASSLKESQLIRKVSINHMCNTSLAFEADQTDLIGESYRVGVLLGDGCVTKSCTIATGTQEFADYLAKVFKPWGEVVKYFHERCWYISVKRKGGRGPSVKKGEFRSPVMEKLNEYRLLGKTAQEKRIPSFVRQSKSLLAACIRGLIDTDGSVLPGKPWHITSTSPQLINDISWAMNQLGISHVTRTNRIYFSNLEQLRWTEYGFKSLPYEGREDESQVYPRKRINSFIDRRRKQTESIKDACFRQNYSYDKYNSKLPWIRKSSIPSLILTQLQIEESPFYTYVKNIQHAGTRRVYDITTKHSHQFNVSGHIVHNCMHIAKNLCGYTGAEADDLRKAIGKKIPEKMAKHEPKFKEGWVKNGLPKAEGNTLWEDMVSFASYGFNKSHAAAYAMITYQTAWLKTYYPTEYMCAAMISDAGDKDQMIKYLAECKRLGIKVLPPDINNSRATFHVDGPELVRFGLGPIKNLGAGSLDIIKERTEGGLFTDIRNFCERVDTSAVNSKKVDSLIKAGAFDSFGVTRAALLASIPLIWEHKKQQKAYSSKLNTYAKKLAACEQREKDIEDGKLSEKGKKLRTLKPPVRPVPPAWPELSELDESPKEIIQADEHDLLGFYVSSHPLDGVMTGAFGQKFNAIEDVKQMNTGTKVSLAVVITKHSEITTAKKKKQMSFPTLEDMTGSIDSICFPNVYDKCGHLLDDPRPMEINGRVDVTEADDGRITKIMISRIVPLKAEITRDIPERIETTVKATRVKDFLALIEKYKGTLHEVRVAFQTESGMQARCPVVVKIGNYKGAFMRELAKLDNEHE